jgi:hypothetical protein
VSPYGIVAPEDSGTQRMTKPKAKPPIVATPPQKFNELLTWHMANGTRPDASGKPGEPWRTDLLAKATRCDAASLRNWRRGRFMPGERHLHHMANALFGNNSSLLEARKAFLESWHSGHLVLHAQNIQRSIGAFYKNNTPHPNKAKKEEVRDYVVMHLSALCQALEIPLSGVDDAATRLLQKT